MSEASILERRDPCPGATERVETQARHAAVAEERNRIAREIHDTLAQGLAAIRLQLELAQADHELPPYASQAIELAHQIANENFVDARRMISALRSPPPCLATALFTAVDRARRLGPARVVASLEPVAAPPSDVAHELARIAQEAIQNAEHHARARTITVTLEALPGRGLRVTIADDGQGFDPTCPVCGFGLAGMRERAATVEAELAIESAPGAGARVSVTWLPPKSIMG
ncbi:MAG TPA: sensor histidine kinase [Caulobacteraceae bacterium]|jgi:signal transduction histidine kinase|nr:sensor histidine kinase [Caulobacteraceae bacterium]